MDIVDKIEVPLSKKLRCGGVPQTIRRQLWSTYFGDQYKMLCPLNCGTV